MVIQWNNKDWWTVCCKHEYQINSMDIGEITPGNLNTFCMPPAPAAQTPDTEQTRCTETLQYADMFKGDLWIHFNLLSG